MFTFYLRQYKLYSYALSRFFGEKGVAQVLEKEEPSTQQRGTL